MSLLAEAVVVALQWIKEAVVVLEVIALAWQENPLEEALPQSRHYLLWPEHIQLLLVAVGHMVVTVDQALLEGRETLLQFLDRQ